MHALHVLTFLILQGFNHAHIRKHHQDSQLNIQIIHTFGEKELKLDYPFTTNHGDQITLTKFKYYLSNFELTRTDGSIWKQPNSYYLIEVSEDSPATAEVKLGRVPSGEYTHLAFSIGVDSVSNHSSKQEGALDPDNGMFWMWETGYVFFKLEGVYQTPSGSKGALVYHIGRDHCYRKISLVLPAAKRQISEKNTQLQLIADANKVFGGFPNAAIDLKSPSDNSSVGVMSGEKAAKAASNYAQMFLIK